MPVAPISDWARKPLAYGADRITFGPSQEKRFPTVPVRPPTARALPVAAVRPFLLPFARRITMRSTLSSSVSKLLAAVVCVAVTAQSAVAQAKPAATTPPLAWGTLTSARHWASVD